MNEIKEFLKGLPKSSESHILSIEEQEMIEGGACEGVSCKNSCEPGRKKNIEVKDNTLATGQIVAETRPIIDQQAVKTE